MSLETAKDSCSTNRSKSPQIKLVREWERKTGTTRGNLSEQSGELNPYLAWSPESKQAKLVSTLFLLHHQITLLVLLRARSKLQQLFWYTRLTFIFSVTKIDKVKYCYTNVLNRTRLSFLPYLLLLFFLWNSTWLSLLSSVVFILLIYTRAWRFSDS